MTTQKKQKLSNFDFSVEGAHVALVTRAANGKEAPLIVKKVKPVEKGEYYEGDDETTNGSEIKMSLTDFLRIHCHMWADEARLIANSIVKSAEANPEAYAEILKKIPTELLSDEPVRHAQTQTEVTKMSTVDTNAPATPDVQKTADQVALEKKVSEQDATLVTIQAQLKKYEEAEEIRKAAKFGALAAKNKSLGGNDELAVALQAMSDVEGFDAVVAILDGAVETLEKAELLKPKGVDGEQVVIKSIDELQTIAKGYMESDKTLTIQKALVKAATAHPHLVK